jgi:hypothetical protein
METANIELKGFIQEVFNPFVEEVRAGFEEVLSALHEFAHSVDQRFDMVDQRFEAVDKRFEAVDERFDRIEGKVGRIGASMVTKDYLDDKFAREGSRYGGLDLKTNEKIYVLADALVAEGSLSTGAAKRVVTAEPFPRRK